MSLITFISNNELTTLTSGKVVFTSKEAPHFNDAVKCAAHLSQLLADEEARIAKAETSAYEQGFEKGQTDGYEAALGHIAAKLLALSKEADQVREKLEKSAGDLALDIVYKISEHIAPQQLLTALAAKAAAQLVSREPVNLRVSVRNLESVRDTVLSSTNFSNRISEVSGDPALDDNECVLETEFGQIKAGLDVQLKSLRQQFHTDG